MLLARRPLAHITRPLRQQWLSKPTSSELTIRSISLLAPHRPALLPTGTTVTTTTTSVLRSTPPPSFPLSPTPTSNPRLDLMPYPTTHPSLTTQQLRFGPRNTYDPSHLVRKRRAGFLARNKSRTGRNILKRRRLKGRRSLTH